MYGRLAAHRSKSAVSLFFDCLYLFLQLLNAFGADILTLVVDDILGTVAENACRMIFVKNDIIPVYENLKCVSLRDIQSAAKLDRQHDPPELIDLSYNTGRFHVAPSVSYKLYPTKIQVTL